MRARRSVERPGNPLRITLTLAMFLACAAVGCDRQPSSGTATSTAPPPASLLPPPAPPSYTDAMKPLAEEMQRMRILLERPPSVQAADFHRQFREVKLRFEQADRAIVAAADRQRKSWEGYGKAMDLLRQVEQGFEQQDALAARADNPPAPDLNELKASTQRTIALIDDMKNASILSVQLPRYMIAAAAKILVAESGLRRGE